MNLSRSADGRQTQVTSFHIESAADCQGKRSSAQLDRVDTQEEVVHHAVTHQNQIQDAFRINASRSGCLLSEPVQSIDNGFVHALDSVRVHHPKPNLALRTSPLRNLG